MFSMDAFFLSFCLVPGEHQLEHNHTHQYLSRWTSIVITTQVCRNIIFSSANMHKQAHTPTYTMSTNVSYCCHCCLTKYYVSNVTHRMHASNVARALVFHVGLLPLHVDIRLSAHRTRPPTTPDSMSCVTIFFARHAPCTCIAFYSYNRPNCTNYAIIIIANDNYSEQ